MIQNNEYFVHHDKVNNRYAVFIKLHYFCQQVSNWYIKPGWAIRKLKQIKYGGN